MDRRTRAGACARRVALLAALLTAATPAVALGQAGTTTLTDWNLTETAVAWGPPTLFHIGSNNGGYVDYRWLDTPNKVTVISANSCVDASLYGSAAIPVNNTSYHGLFSGSTGVCFILRGRTAIGSGSMVNHDGRVRR